MKGTQQGPFLFYFYNPHFFHHLILHFGEFDDLDQ